MKLVRIIDFPDEVKHIHSGPVPGGTFWALKHHNDMYVFGHRSVEMELSYALKHARVWIQDAKSPGTWQEVTQENVRMLPRFQTHVTDDYDNLRLNITVTPFLPEFYVVPNDTFRGDRIRKKAEGKVGKVFIFGMEEKKYLQEKYTTDTRKYPA
jgi:hypothetical protein